MNILHLKYALEVKKCGSITQAAEKLYMSQPNLSKAISELEKTLGMNIFKRTSKGIVPTKKGEEFLSYAKNILDQIDEMEALYRPEKRNTQSFSISVPRASYITHAFASFVNGLDRDKDINISFRETNAITAVNNVDEGDSGLGILRYNVLRGKYILNLLAEKGLRSEPLLEYTRLLLMSKS
ncbi:MAG: LysR family transcriptional regulator, partial [Bacillota bacterium]|nr:LysR family transcriptional regulator [Bacillota bacterium]